VAHLHERRHWGLFQLVAFRYELLVDEGIILLAVQVHLSFLGFLVEVQLLNSISEESIHILESVLLFVEEAILPVEPMIIIDLLYLTPDIVQPQADTDRLILLAKSPLGIGGVVFENGF